MEVWHDQQSHAGSLLCEDQFVRSRSWLLTSVISGAFFTVFPSAGAGMFNGASLVCSTANCSKPYNLRLPAWAEFHHGQ